MNKLYFLLLMCFATAGFSQKFGLKGGVNLGKEKASDSGITITSDTYTSFLAGIYTEFPIDEKFAIAPEAIFSIDGGQFTVQGFGTGIDRLSYISIPLLVKFYPAERFNLHAGPQLGFLLKAESEFNGMKEEFTDDVKGTNLSFDVGAEYSIPAFALGFRYVMGLTNLNDDPDTAAKIQLNTIQIYVAFPFANM